MRGASDGATTDDDGRHDRQDGDGSDRRRHSGDVPVHGTEL